ncbi:hypothetical protein OQA88_12517 [Cercophora sp. LCS_1]
MSSNEDSSVFSAPECTICANASALVRTGENPFPSQITQTMFRPATQFGTVKDLAESATRCAACETMLAKLIARSQGNKVRPFADDDVIEMAYIRFMGAWEISVMAPDIPLQPSSKLTLSSLRAIRHLDPQQPAPSLQEKETTAFAMGNSGVDFSRIKNWLLYCDTHHGGTCHDIQDPWKKVDSPEVLYFVDVENECVSLLPGTTPYLTLSYVWGTHPSPLVSTIANISLLSTPHSLSESSPLGTRLPQTIRDAMAVTRLLGHRYLWIDRLCIIQDDHASKPTHIAAMAAIYGNARLTIIADTHSSSAAGLPGVHAPTRIPFTTITLPSLVALLLDDPLSENSPKSYKNRGWTLQEELLSPRTLKFTPHETKYMCLKSRFREVRNDIHQVRDNRTSSIEMRLFKQQPDVMTYGHLATDYTARLLTYDRDAVNAFSAIISAYSMSMGGMLYGVPEVLFEGALLWDSHTPLRRRDGTAAPSWSFLGWKGKGLSVRTWSALYNNTGRDQERRNVYFQSQVRLVACVEFCKVDEEGKREKVGSSYYGVDADDEEYRHRVPIPREPHAVGKMEWGPVVMVRTQMGNVMVGEGFAGEDGRCKDVKLLGDDGAVIGALRLNGLENGVSGTKVSMVVISRGITSQRPHTWEMPEMAVIHADCGPFCFSGSCKAEKRFVPYDFYNVLWVRFVDGIAYREGIGRVLRSAWDRLGAEEVEISLG